MLPAIGQRTMQTTPEAYVTRVGWSIESHILVYAIVENIIA